MKFILSRKFLTAVASILFIVLTQVLNVQVDQTAYWSIMGTAIAYILAEAHVDGKKIKAQATEPTPTEEELASQPAQEPKA